MKLKTIKLYNFRQFYGATPEIQLASGKANTTIIHGNNGAGKTTLLNAFTWVLYGELTAALANSQQLVNQRAVQEAIPGKSIEYSVELNFEHDYKSYQLKRRCYATKHQDNETLEQGESQLFMLVAGDDGCWQPPLEYPVDIIGRILPANLHQYFFFDGERIDHIIRYQKKTGLTEATKELLGIKIFERSAEHLKTVRRRLENELQQIGDIKTQEILQNKQQVEQELEETQKQQSELDDEITQKQQQKQQLAQALLDLKGAENLLTIKKNLERDYKETREQLIRLNQTVKKAISSQGYTLLMSELVEQCSSLFEQITQANELPHGIKKPFVEQLLNQKRCICGTDLIEGSVPYQHVKNWIDKAEQTDVEEALIHLQSHTQQLEKQVKTFWETVDDSQQQITALREKLANLEEELETVKQQLRDYPDQEIKQLQHDLDVTEQEIETLLLKKGRNDIQLNQQTNQLEKLSKQLHQEQTKQGKSELAKRRCNATEQSMECIKQLKADLESRFRATLENKVQEIFSTISFTPYLPKLNANYELSLVEQTSGEENEVAASTGENQILSLSLIGGIMDQVRHWSAHHTLIAPDSSTFPMVMDSPFGSLDEIYRRQVAKALPCLANQLVVLVTQTQWRGEVAKEMNDAIGKHYILVYFSPKPDCEEDWLTIKGQSYPLVQPSANGFEYTEIIEVD